MESLRSRKGFSTATTPPQGGKPAPEKSKLETMLAEALRNNPDIRVAAAKLAEAEADLNRTRLQVTQKVVTHHQAILSQKAVVNLAQKRYEHVKRLLDMGIGGDEIDEAIAKLEIAKAKLTEAEAELPYLLGRAAQVESGRKWEYRGFLEPYYQKAFDNTQTIKVQGPLTERIRKALQTAVKVDYKNVPFKDVLKDLEKKVPGLSFRDVIIRDKEPNVTLQFEEPLPVSAILQALTDDCGIRFFVRDYGIRVIPMNFGNFPDLLTVEQFLRQKPPEK
jgi:hypothetical protein